MRVGIDCRLAGAAHAGIGRYIENLVRQVLAMRPEEEWIFFFFEKSQAQAVLGNSFEALMKNSQVVFAPIKHYSIAEQLKMVRVFQAQKLDLLHVPHFNVPLLYQGKLVVTIHDLLWHEYKGTEVTTLKPWLYWMKYFAYRFVATQAVSKAQAILVPAETIKKTLIRYYPGSASKVVVTKEGASIPIKSNQKKTLTTDLLYIGSLYPHKNVKLIVQALKSLPDHRLLIAGSRTVFQDQLRSLVSEQGVTDQVTFLGYVSDDDLSVHFSTVKALVQPSFSEGFGLTGIEAMAAGVPVLASDIPIFREIYQDGAAFFDPHQPESLVKAVRDLKPEVRQTLVRRGPQVAAQYSWEKMAQETVMVYNQVYDR